MRRQNCRAIGPLVQILILTGQRLRQVAGMRREEIEGLGGETALWRVPNARMKGKREHEVPSPYQLSHCLEG